jgi:hypothetical protein
MNTPETQSGGSLKPVGSERCIVYSGPHYGRVHRILKRQDTLTWVEYHGDRFGVPHCDIEIIPNAKAQAQPPESDCGRSK